MGRLGKTLVSVGSILIVAVVGILIYCYWPAITGTVNNNKYYTQEDVQKAYDDGYADGNKSESELTTKYEYYKSLVDDYYVQVTTLNEEINKLSNENANYSTQVKNLTTQKTNLQAQVDNLTSIKETNESTIADLNNQITNLQSQVKNLTNSSEDKSEQIANLNTQITNLQNTVSQLQTTNKMNLDTITSLNNQISSLNAQISEMTENSQNYTSKINALNSKISELQKSIAYYEAYIAQLENTEQVVATFEFDGSVYNIQIVNKGSKLSVVTPTSTEYKIFNGWKVNGQAIDLNTFTITTNTKIVADITYKFDVKFKVENEIVSSQIIIKDNYATLPSNPTKEGYEFDGWSLNGVNVISDIATKPVTENTTYIAVFTKLHTVTFVYENETKSTQTIRNGELAKNVSITNTDYKVFKGWKVNGIIVDLTTYKILSNTTFVADITYKFDVKFMVDNTVYNSQIIATNETANVPNTPTKDKYLFVGWSIDGTNVVNVSNYAITQNTTFVALFKLNELTVTFKNGDEVISTQKVLNGEKASKPDFDTKTFLGWTIDGTNVIDLSSYSITENTVFIAKFGTYQVIYNEALRFGGIVGQQKLEVTINGLKAGDKIRTTIMILKMNVGENSPYYGCNSDFNEGCAYGYWLDSTFTFYKMTSIYDERETACMDFSSSDTFVEDCGVLDYNGTVNVLTFKMYCEKDGVLTIECSDKAGFFVENGMFSEIEVLR